MKGIHELSDTAILKTTKCYSKEHFLIITRMLNESIDFFVRIREID